MYVLCMHVQQLCSHLDGPLALSLVNQAHPKFNKEYLVKLYLLYKQTSVIIAQCTHIDPYITCIHNYTLL